MIETSTIFLGASGWLVWGAKELLATLYRNWAARQGAQLFLPGRTTMLATSGSHDLAYFSHEGEREYFKDCDRFRLELEGEFFNDSETAVVYTSPELHVWGVEGPRLTHSNPQFQISSEKGWKPIPTTGTVTVPPHGTLPVRFVVFVGNSVDEVIQQISTYYYDSVIELVVKTPAGAKRRFRLCKSSFCGRNHVSWPDRGKFPIYSLCALNRDGRKAGARAQPARPYHAVDQPDPSE
jgi:hypothetical protein